MNTDPRVDAYVAAAAPFARPLLERLRTDIHAAVPDGTETMKWGRPAFERRGLLGGFAAFRSHVALYLWRGHEIETPAGLAGTSDGRELAWIRFEEGTPLPAARTLRAVIRRAAKHAEAVRAEGRPRTARPPPEVPSDLTSALAARGQAKARRFFEQLPPSAQRDYVTWLEDAKRPATRARRLETTLAWLAEGKRRNWKYESR